MKNDLAAHYELGNDIDASASQEWNDGAGFQRIGASNNDPFLGVLNGNNYQITGLVVNLQQTNIGMFGSVGEDAVIQNLHLVDVDISGDSNVGGLVGFNFGTVTNSSVSGIVKGYFNVGCIAGGNVEYNAGVSGLIEFSYSSCTLEGVPKSGSSSARIGGLVGWNAGGKIGNSYSIASISGGNDIGGIVGNHSGFTEVNEKGYVRNVYFAGTISGEANMGGLFGTFYAEGADVSSISSYWDTETSGLTEGFGTAGEETLNIAGLTSAEMQTQSSFEGWDFNEVWSIDEGESYPYLQSSSEQIVTSNVNENGSFPNKFSLAQNYPNPFNPTTNISFVIPQANEVRLQIFDMLGRNVGTLLNEQKAAGSHTVRFDGSNLSSGMYIYRIEAGSFTQTRKLMLIK
jgi:hypothetical protein